MTDNDRKMSRKPLLVFLLTFVGLAILLTILALLDTHGLPMVIGTYFLYGGLLTVVFSFFLLNAGDSRWSGYAQSNYMRNVDYFKKVRAQEKPLEKIIWSVISAALLIAFLGYVLNRLLVW